MANSKPHIIKKQVIELHMGDPTLAEPLQQLANEVLHEHLRLVLD